MNNSYREINDVLTDPHYVYLFVREDLSVSQQVIQTVHATQLTGWVCQGGEVPNAVLVGAQSEDDLMTISEYLIDHHIAHEVWYEPDISAHTAIATYPIKGKDRNALKHFQLKR